MITRARYYDWTNQREKGAEIWGQVTQQNTNEDEFYFFAKGRLLENTGDFPAASLAYNEVIKRNPDISDPWYAKSLVLDQMGDLVGCLDALENISTEKYPAYTDILIRSCPALSPRS